MNKCEWILLEGMGGEEDGKYKWGKVSSYGIFLLDC